jgi:hypothetical protein
MLESRCDGTTPDPEDLTRFDDVTNASLVNTTTLSVRPAIINDLWNAHLVSAIQKA